MKVMTIANTDINELVQVENEQVVTDSRKVGEVFDKPHKTVLRSIENIITEAKNGLSDNSAQNCAQSFFYETTYKDGSGKSNKMYLMNRDGFSLLVMGFTGAKAMQWKIKYIEAFNEMEKRLKAQSSDSYMIADPIERALKWAEEEKIRQEQAKQLEMQKPLVVFGNAVKASSTSILIGALAKLLKQNGIDMGQKRLFQWMRDTGYLIKSGNDKNMPTQRAMEMGLFEIKEGNYIDSNDVNRITRTTKVTGKGQVYFINKFLAEAKKAKQIAAGEE